MLVVNASNIQKDLLWIKSKNNIGADIKDVSDEISLLAVQGPKAVNVLQELTKVDLSVIPYYSFKIGAIAGIPEVIISNTGYTGAGGFELYVRNKDVEPLWIQLFIVGDRYGIKPIGLGARDTLRLEMGYCLYGNDINDSTSPLEAGLAWITKFNKEFTASKILKEQKENGLSRKLVAFEMIDKGIARHDYKILDASGQKIGVVTSGTHSPTLKKSIGLGYVNIDSAKVGNVIFIEIRGIGVKATVVTLPFVKQNLKCKNEPAKAI